MSAAKKATVRFPNVHVTLVGRDGSAMSILGNVSAALKKGGATQAERDEFMSAAMASDYNHLLATCTEWVNVS